MDPRDFCKLAIELARRNQSAAKRSAVSRAYYSVFNVAAEHLREVVPLGRGPQAHGDVRRCLGSCGNSAVVAAGSDLGSLHSLRNTADYSLGDLRMDSGTTAEAAAGMAAELITILDREFRGAQRDAMKGAIQSYWKTVLRRPLGTG